MFVLKREDLILYSQGTLMTRSGYDFQVVNSKKCREAEERLANGEKIGLIVDDVLFSTMQLVDGCFEEKEIQ